MVVKGGGYTIDLEAETFEDRRKVNRRKDDVQRTIQENVAGRRLEDTPSSVDNSPITNSDGVDNSDESLKEQYEASLTDPRRS